MKFHSDPDYYWFAGLTAPYSHLRRRTYDPLWPLLRQPRARDGAVERVRPGDLVDFIPHVPLLA